MRATTATALASLLAVVHGGCRSDNSQEQISALRKEVALLRDEVDRLTTKSSQLEAKANEIAGDVFVLQLETKDADRVALEPDSPGYAALRVSGAVFLMSLQKVEPYADGQRLTLHIGNPQSVAYPNPTLELTWGPRLSKETSETWSNSLRKKEERLLTTLEPGAWNQVRVNVGPATSEEIGYIGVGMKVSTVSMPVRR